jgi:hypothetical protein
MQFFHRRRFSNCGFLEFADIAGAGSLCGVWIAKLPRKLTVSRYFGAAIAEMK